MLGAKRKECEEEEEIWKPVPGFERYSCSNYGRVKKATNHFLATFVKTTGYEYVTLAKDSKKYRKKIDNLVATLFLPNEDKNKRYILHKNGDYQDSRLSNLEWIASLHFTENGKKRKFTPVQTYLPKEDFSIYLDVLKQKVGDICNVEYRLHPKKGHLTFRKLKLDGGWTDWLRCCKHTKKPSLCAECFFIITKEEKRDIVFNQIMTDKKEKCDTLTAKRTDIIKRQCEMKRIERYNIKEKVKVQRDRNRRSDRFNKISEFLLVAGNVDLRKQKIVCSNCSKILIPHEFVDYNLKNNESFSRCNLSKNTIVWAQYCNNCSSLIRRTDYKCLNSLTFNRHICGIVKRHTNGDMDDCRKISAELKERNDGKCGACGTTLLFQGESGYSQASITDRNPYKHKKTNENGTITHVSADVSELELVCHACQNCQNQMKWCDFLDFLLKVANSCTNIINHMPFSGAELTWLTKYGKTNINMSCPSHMRLEIAKRDGRYCKYTGIELKFESHFPNTASFDRVDSSQPYSVEQTFLVCKSINYVKTKSITEDELLKWISHVRENKEHIQKMYEKEIATQ